MSDDGGDGTFRLGRRFWALELWNRALAESPVDTSNVITTFAQTLYCGSGTVNAQTIPTCGTCNKHVVMCRHCSQLVCVYCMRALPACCTTDASSFSNVVIIPIGTAYDTHSITTLAIMRRFLMDASCADDIEHLRCLADSNHYNAMFQYARIVALMEPFQTDTIMYYTFCAAECFSSAGMSVCEWLRARLKELPDDSSPEYTEVAQVLLHTVKWTSLLEYNYRVRKCTETLAMHGTAKDGAASWWYRARCLALLPFTGTRRARRRAAEIYTSGISLTNMVEGLELVVVPLSTFLAAKFVPGWPQEALDSYPGYADYIDATENPVVQLIVATTVLCGTMSVSSKELNRAIHHPLAKTEAFAQWLALLLTTAPLHEPSRLLLARVVMEGWKHTAPDGRVIKVHPDPLFAMVLASTCKRLEGRVQMADWMAGLSNESEPPIGCYASPINALQMYREIRLEHPDYSDRDTTMDMLTRVVDLMTTC